MLAKIEPSGFFVSLASHIFIFLNKHMLTSEATIISNYIKNGLAEPQMIVLADMIHDLEGMVSFSNMFLTWYFVSKIVLTYCKKKIVLVIENFF